MGHMVGRPHAADEDRKEFRQWMSKARKLSSHSTQRRGPDL